MSNELYSTPSLPWSPSFMERVWNKYANNLTPTSPQQSDGGGGVNSVSYELVYSNSTGDIYCKACSRNSPAVLDCTHVMHHFWANTDLATLWDFWPLEVKIPIASKRGIWAIVEIDGWAAGPPPPDNKAIVSFENAGGMEPVCIISRTEGRLVIRSALLQMMYGDFSFSRSCASTSHGIREEQLWNRQVTTGDESSAERVAQLWSVYTTGVCIPCNEKIEAALNFATPDRQGGNVWNPNG